MKSISNLTSLFLMVLEIVIKFLKHDIGFSPRVLPTYRIYNMSKFGKSEAVLRKIG